jgi:hypothetical protein
MTKIKEYFETLIPKVQTSILEINIKQLSDYLEMEISKLKSSLDDMFEVEYINDVINILKTDLDDYYELNCIY